MTPVAEIAKLDRMLADRGTTMTLRRGSATVAVRVFLSRKPAADQLTAQQISQEQDFVMSPTEIVAAGWPGGDLSGFPDPRIPRKGDVLVTTRGPLTVQDAAGREIGGVLIRIDGKVKG